MPHARTTRLTVLACLFVVGAGALRAEEAARIRFSEAPHSYFTRPPRDAFSQLAAESSR